MTKQEQIDLKLSTPIKEGDEVNIHVVFNVKENVKVGKNKFETIEKEKSKSGIGKIIRILPNTIHGLVYVVKSNEFSVPHEVQLEKIKDYPDKPYNEFFVLAKWVTPRTHNCGANPFRESPRINFQNTTLEMVILKLGYYKRNNFVEPEYKIMDSNNGRNIECEGKTYGGANLDPFIIDSEGNRKNFQRGLVWTLEQKQLLISSVYNGIEIGKFLFKYNSWEKLVKDMVELGHGYDFDCIDGKQRLTTFVSFFKNEFPDEYGNYFKDLSTYAQRQFLDYGKLAVGTIDEKATNKDVINAFLYLNFTGTPMSKDHIDYVQSIKL